MHYIHMCTCTRARTHTHTHTHTPIPNPTYQSSVLPTNPVDVSAMRTHGASAVSMPTQPPREQEEDTSHTPVAAEALEGGRKVLSQTPTLLSYVPLCQLLCFTRPLHISHSSSLILLTSPQDSQDWHVLSMYCSLQYIIVTSCTYAMNVAATVRGRQRCLCYPNHSATRNC